jgi:hypothetical protein
MAASFPVVIASDQSAVPVSATNLDIRDLTFAADKADVSGSSVTVTATNLDIRDLTFAADKVDTSGSSVIAAGAVASGDADTGNPVPIGLRVETTLPTAEADNDRVRIIGDTTGRVFTRNGHQGPANNYWDAQHVPAANTQATISQAAAAAGIRNVCTGFTVTLAAQTTAPAAVQLTVAVIDGASGGTTYLWRSVVSLPATAGAIVAFVRSNIWLVGTAATAMTVEFSAAGGANTIESVTMEGTTVAE